MTSRELSIALLLCTALVACRGTRGAEDAETGGTTYVLAALLGEPDAAVAAIESQVRFPAAEELVLFAAESEDRDGALHALLILDVASVTEARRLIDRDSRARGLEAQLTTFESAAPLRELPRLAGRPDADGGARTYVLATCNRGAAATRRLARDARVLFHGDLGPPAEGSSLFCLDARSRDEAEALLRSAGLLQGFGASWALDTVRASDALASLPRP